MRQSQSCWASEITHAHTLSSWSGVLQLSLAARCRLEVTGGSIREQRRPRVLSAKTFVRTHLQAVDLGLLPPLGCREVWQGDTPTLTLLCPACHLTFMLDVSSPAAAIQSPQNPDTNATHAPFKVRPRTCGGGEKRSEQPENRLKVDRNNRLFVFVRDKATQVEVNSVHLL